MMGVQRQSGRRLGATHLNLARNDLSGSIPTQIGDLTNLTELNLAWNDWSGPIPDEIGSLTNLTHLNLRGIGLSGSIPTQIGDLTNLTFLDLGWNDWSGPIPDEIGSLTNLTHLNLSNIGLSGPIPTWIRDLTNLTFLSLGSNRLSGRIPAWIGDLTNLTQLWLYANGRLSGPIPSELGDLANLTHLDLQINSFWGLIPPELGDLSNLELLNLEHNGLGGPIPRELGELTRLRFLKLNDNSLSGCVPSALSSVNFIEFDLGLKYCHQRVGVISAERLDGTSSVVRPGAVALIWLRLVDGAGDPLGYTAVSAEISAGSSVGERVRCSAPRAALLGSVGLSGCVTNGEGWIVFSYRVSTGVSLSRQSWDSLRIYIDEDGDGAYDEPPIGGVPGEPVYYYGVRIAEPISYVALGDSYSAGENGRHDASSVRFYQSAKPADPDCHRWVEAYPLVFAEDHLGDDRLHNVVTYACTGAVTYNVYDDRTDSDVTSETNRPSHVAEGDMMNPDWEPRQGESLAAAGGVDMVTVTMGGNDAGFAKVLEACMTGKCDQSTLDGQESLADIGARIEAVLSQIKLDAPGASVFVLGYPYLTPRYVPIACRSLRPDSLLDAVGIDPIAVELLYQVLYEVEPAARAALADAIAVLYLTGARLTDEVRDAIQDLTDKAEAFAAEVRDAGSAANLEARKALQEALTELKSVAVAFSAAVRASVTESMAGVGEAALANAEAQQAAARALADAVSALGEVAADTGGAVLDSIVQPVRDQLDRFLRFPGPRSDDAAEGIEDAVDFWIDNFTLYGRVYSSGFDLIDALRIDTVEALLLRRAADALNAEISNAAAAAGVHFVSVTGLFDGHAPCESVPWVNGVEGQSVMSIPSFEGPDDYFEWLIDLITPDGPVSGKSFHPNMAGHRAYASALANYIRARLRATGGGVTLAGLPTNPTPDPSRGSGGGSGGSGVGIRSVPDSGNPIPQDTPLKDSKDAETPPANTQQVSLAGGLLVRQHAVAPGADCSAGAALSGARLEFTGEGFAAGAAVRLAVAGATVSGTALAATQLAAVTADADGAISFTWAVPDWSESSDLSPRLYVPLAVGPSPGGGLVAAATAMPLVAYTVGVPCAASDTASTSLDSTVRVAVLANDTGPLQAATVMVDPVAGGNFNVDASDGSVTFTPDAGFYGTVSTSYRVADSHGLIVGADLTVTVDAGCTITGTAGVVEITGTDGDDVICVPDTLDVTAFHVIDAKAGNDTILAGDGIDWIHTGAGDDKVYARGADDTVHTGEGTDTVYGGAGFDTIHALSLVDTIIDDPGGYELIIGTAGSSPAAPQTQDDRAHANVGQVVTIFVLGNDFDPDEDLDSSTLRITRSPTMGTARLVDIDGNAALQYTAPLVDATEVIAYEVCDQLSACSTAEVTVTVGTTGCTIVGTDSADTLHGSPGDDVICGGAGDDIIYGNGGDDIIIGGGGNDTLYGGDATRIGAQDGDDIILGAAGDDVIYGGAGDDTIYGGVGDDTIYGNRGPDVIVGGAGNDIIVGGGENDTLWGGPGVDNLDGHAGNDTIHAGTGNDSLRGGNGDDTLWGGPGDDTITAGAGDDILRGGPGNDTLWGNTQDDTLWGGPGDDTLNGQGHNDELHGGTGDDSLHSGAGDDIAHGDSGDDTLDGGPGTDYLNGGTGNDTCTRGHTTTHCEPDTVHTGTNRGQ